MELNTIAHFLTAIGFGVMAWALRQIRLRFEALETKVYFADDIAKLQGETECPTQSSKH